MKSILEIHFLKMLLLNFINLHVNSDAEISLSSFLLF